MEKPIIKLENGRRVKSTFENEHYFFYNTMKESTATEICEKLLELGFDASVGRGYGQTKWFARVRKTDAHAE